MANGKYIISKEDLEKNPNPKIAKLKKIDKEVDKQTEFEKTQSLLYSLLNLSFSIDKKNIMKHSNFTDMAVYVLTRITESIKNGEGK